jgi:hypothetical protein
VLGHAVLDRDDRVLRAPAREEIDELFRRQALAFAGEVVLAVVEELARRAVQSEQDVLARLVAGLADGFENGFLESTV